MATHDATLATAARALGMPTVACSTGLSGIRSGVGATAWDGGGAGGRWAGTRKTERIRIRSRPAVMLATNLWGQVWADAALRGGKERQHGKRHNLLRTGNRKPESRDLDAYRIAVEF